jgi:TctA family transporter
MAMIGLDPQSGTQRYTFGMLELWDGVGLVPVTVGLFGVGELVDLWIKQKSISEKRVGKVGGMWQGCKDTFAEFGLTMRCSLIGTFLGIIPGLGGAVGQWVSYAHSVQSSKDKSKFGKGDVRGVLGPGAAMNAKEGGTLVTTVAFGVPSSVSMAILLGAFLIQGIVPGPSMLTTKVDLTFSFVWVLIISHIISVALSFLLINQMVRITEVRSALILPAIIFLVLFGGFSEKNSIFDMFITLISGFVGMIMVALDWPRPPLILGLVLGRLIENNLFISYARYEFSFMTRPVLLVIIAVTLGLILWPIVQSRLAKRIGVKEGLIAAEEG